LTPLLPFFERVVSQIRWLVTVVSGRRSTTSQDQDYALYIRWDQALALGARHILTIYWTMGPGE